MTDRTEAEAVAEITRAHGEAKTLELAVRSGGEDIKATILLLPTAQGVTVKGVKDLVDQYRENPERKTGLARLETLESFIGHVKRFKNANSALFCTAADRDKPSIQAVLDYHEAGEGKPKWLKHRSLYSFPVSDEWLAWKAINNDWMSMGDFQLFLETRLIDIVNPESALAPVKQLVENLCLAFAAPNAVLNLSKGLKAKINRTVSEATNLSSGEGELFFEEDHRDSSGNKLKIPNAFLISIPVFRAGEQWQIAVLLRYRFVSGAVRFQCAVHQFDAVYDAALKEAAQKASTETELQLFYGAPEASS